MKKIYLLLLALLPLSVFAQTSPPQPVITSSGTTSCTGPDTLKVPSAGPGATYLWQLNGQPILQSSGYYTTTDTFYVARYSGTYTVWDSTANWYPTYSTPFSPVSAPYEVTGLPLPGITIGQGGRSVVCYGDSAQLYVPHFGSATYQWYKNSAAIAGATDTLIYASSAGTYSVKINFAGGCTQTIDTSIFVNSSRITASLSQNTLGDSLIVSASGGTAPYNYLPQWEWYKAINNNMISIDSAGSYTVTVQDVYGCTVTTNTLTVIADSVTGIVTNSSNAPVANTTVQLLVSHAGTVSVLNSIVTDNNGNFVIYSVAKSGYLLATATNVNYLPTYFPSTSVFQNATVVNFSSDALNEHIILIDTATTISSPPAYTPVITSSGASACNGVDTLRVPSIGANASYMWYNNGFPVTITTDTFLVVTQSGFYNVYADLNGNPIGSALYEVTGLPVSLNVYFPTSLNGYNIDSSYSLCGGDSATITFIQYSNAAYKWAKNNAVIAGQTSNTLTVKTGGVYEGTITFSGNGCSYTVDTTITQGGSIAATLSRNSVGDSLIVTANGGTAPYLYMPLFPLAGGRDNNTFYVNAAGSYSVYVKDASGACAISDTLAITADTISGIVTNSSNVPVSNTVINLLVTNPDNSVSTVGYAQTNSNGYYSMITIVNEGYLVADPWDSLTNSGSYIATYYPSVPVIQNASLVTINSSAVTANIQLLNAAQSSGSGQISGVINGSSSSNRLTTASSGSGPIAGLTIVLLNANNQPVATTTTNSSGFFEFTNLAAGNYKIWVDGNGVNNATAPVVTVTSGSSISSTNLQFALSGSALSVTEVTGITSATAASNGISVYPNPASSSLNVSVYGGSFSNFSYTLSDGQGNQLAKGQGTSTIDVSGLEPGLYILSVQTAETVSNQKVIIER